MNEEKSITVSPKIMIDSNCKGTSIYNIHTLLTLRFPIPVADYVNNDSMCSYNLIKSDPRFLCDSETVKIILKTLQ